MNIVYIDVQNTHKRALDNNRCIDRQRLYLYLKKKCKADKIYYAVGYLPELKPMYIKIEQMGYHMLYKESYKVKGGDTKGNVDIDIAIRAIFDICEEGLQKAYLITNDGDYNTLIHTFKQRGVFGYLITPDSKTAGHLIKRAAGGYIQDMQRLRPIIELQNYVKKSGTNSGITKNDSICS